MKSNTKRFGKLCLHSSLIAGWVLLSTACGSAVPQNDLTTELQNSFNTSGFGQGYAQNQTPVATMPTGTLTESETDSLLYMREEEKLARDVYRTLSEKWQVRVFANIAQSEQRHMDALKVLLDKYALDDPVTHDEVGAFTNPDLQELYTQLLASGEESLVHALQVGASIEDLDLKDLQEALKNTTQSDVQMVYAQLMRGSRNHLRAFVRNLTAAGATYTPQYLAQAEYDAIVQTAMERGGNGRGQGLQGGFMGGGPHWQ